MKLWVRMATSFSVVIIIAGVMVTMIVNQQVSDDMHADQQRWSEVLTRAIAKSIINDTIKTNSLAVKETLKRILKHSNDIDYIAVVDFDGKPFASTFDDGLQHNLAIMDHLVCTDKQFNDLKYHLHVVKNASASASPQHQHSVTDYVYPLIDNLNAHIHLGLNEQAIDDAIVNAQRRVLVVVVITSLLGMLLAIYISRRITMPLEKLTSNIRNFREHGDFYPMQLRSVDNEIKELIGNFESFIEERKRYEKEILDYRDHLEEMVGERTEKLAREITQHKETANQLAISKEEAERANKAKSQFLSSMSHELRTPLNAIMGFSQLIELNLSETDGENRDNINEVLNASKHLLSLINEVLDLAKIESGKMELSLEPVVWKDVINECIKLVERSVEQKNITLLYDDSLCHCDNASIIADYMKLKQVVLNLLSNAVKYNRDGGQVRVILSSLDQHTCRLLVEDTGYGIPEKLQRRVFRAFDRLEAENSEVEGTGIGLVITKALVEKMQGSIGFTSKPGKGSRFWIDMPVSQQQVPEDSVLDAINESGLHVNGKRTILYIEDNAQNISLVTKIFTACDDIELVVAETPGEAFRILETMLPDLVLLDIHLPEMSGFDVMKRLSSDSKTASIKVIAVSANAMQHDLEKANDYGFVAYITKPYDIREFLSIINQNLD